jgi:hypothetical protein
VEERWEQANEIAKSQISQWQLFPEKKTTGYGGKFFKERLLVSALVITDKHYASVDSIAIRYYIGYNAWRLGSLGPVKSILAGFD